MKEKVIREKYRGDGLTELFDDEKPRHRIKKTAWIYLLFVAWEMIFGSIFMRPQNTSTVMYAAYWTQTILLAFVWILANWPRKKSPTGK